MVTILLQKILDLLKENLSNMIKFFVTDPQDGQTLVYDAEAEEWKNDYVEIELQETASGSVATFDTEATQPLVSLKANITATQSGSGTPSPSNPRPISGFSSVTLTQKDSEDTTVYTFTISLGDTYYGGVLDCKNGTATITQKYFTYTEAMYYGTYGDDNAPLYYVEISDYQTKPIKNMQNSKLAGVLNSNIFTKISAQNATSMLDNEIRTQAGTRPQYFYFRADNFADLTAVNAFLANTPLQVVAELQTPITLTLTPDNFTTIAGENNIFADSGDVEVIYNTTSAQKVWDISNHVKDITSDLTIDYETIDESTCNVKAYRQGNMVIVQINIMTYLTTPTDTAVIITGLPKPVAAITSCVGDGYDLERCIRLRVNTDGELQQWYSRPYPNHNAQGQIVYITDEV